jgi:UDP-glucose 4-epimerase
MTRVLVTGGAGFIGSHLVDALAARGDEIVVLDNMHRGRRAFIERHLDGPCKLIEGDIRDPETVEMATAGTDVIYHLAAQSNVLGAIADAHYSFSTNVLGTYNVLEGAHRAGIHRVVFSSSREVYGDPEWLPVPEHAPLLPKNPYGASKVAGEAYCRAFTYSLGLDVAVIRLANVYGERDSDRVIPRWLGLAESGQKLTVYGGKQVLDFVPVGLAVEALIYAADHGLAGPVNIGSGIGTPILDLAERIGVASGGRSGVDLLPANTCEVVRFVADVSRMRSLGITPPGDPLCDLERMMPHEKVEVVA